MEDYHCPKEMECILHQCEIKAKYCDASGKCPEGYKNYWGVCWKFPLSGCKGHSDCPSSITACNKKDKNCYVVSCWTDTDCKATLNPVLSPIPMPKCFRPNSIGSGYCYK